MEIKLRIWDKEKGEMIYNAQEKGLILIPTEPFWSVAQSNPVNNTIDDNYLYSWSDGDIIDGRYIPLQFIGLKDKNGKKIYEEDIIKIKYEGTDEIHKVKWEITTDGDGHLCSGFFLISAFSEEDIEVIGNVYEHPNLLN